MVNIGMLTKMLTKTGITHSSKEIYNLVKHFGPGKNILNKQTGDFFYDEWEVLPEYKDTSLEGLLSKIGKVGQARVNVLKPGECFFAHADIDDRFHLALDSEYSFLTDIIGAKLYCVGDDNVYEMDAGRLHSASNYGYKNRYQLVIRKLLNRIDLQEPAVVTCMALQPTPYNLRYLFDCSFSCLLNKFNKLGVMTNFQKISDTSIKFDVEYEFVQEVLKLKETCGFGVLINYD